MSTWLAMKQALTVVDFVTRKWARDLDLDECGVVVLMLLAQRGERPSHELAFYCGRSRQQVQRSLRHLEARGLVVPLWFSRAGRVKAWGLTQRGQATWQVLERAVIAWDEELERKLDVAELKAMLQRIVELAVNRPGGDGWRRGLIVPHELLFDPIRPRAAMEGLLKEVVGEEDDTGDPEDRIQTD